MNGKAARTVAAAVPVLLVNAVAFTGQLAFLRQHLPWPAAGQVMMAAALESVAVYLSFQAHLAALAQDSALRLKLASYGFAVIIAVLNYSHYARPGWQPTFAAVAVALMSASSPWLWGVHSRRASRDQMIAAGLIEGRAVRLGATRWLWHPLRSSRVMWFATWAGITDPRAAIGAWETARQSSQPAATQSASATRHAAASVARHDALALPSGETRKSRPSRATRKPVSRAIGADTEARALTELARQPGLSGAELGRLIGASPRTGQRLLSRLSANGTSIRDSREGDAA